MNIKKNLYFLLVIIILPFFLLGCSASAKVYNKNPSLSEIINKIQQSVDISEMKPGDADKLKKLYDISNNDIEDFKLFTAPSNIKAEEIMVIKLKDSDKAESVEGKISKRIQDLALHFKDYLPEQYFIIQKNVIDTKDNYILFVISKDADKISSLFEDSFK